jgi:hypothetical protein
MPAGPMASRLRNPWTWRTGPSITANRPGKIRSRLVTSAGIQAPWPESHIKPKTLTYSELQK